MQKFLIRSSELLMLVIIITFKVAAVYGLPSPTIAFCEVASLDHKILNNPMKC